MRTFVGAGRWCGVRLLAILLAGGGCQQDCNPCDGPPFPDQGAAVAAGLSTAQIYATGDLDADGIRDLVSLDTTTGQLRVLLGPSFLEEALSTALPEFLTDQPWRYALSIRNPDPINSRRIGILYLLDRKTAVVTTYTVRSDVQKLRETLLAITDADRKNLNQTTAFAAVWDGPYPLNHPVFALAHTWLTPSGFVELEFFDLDGHTYSSAGCATPRDSRCVTQLPVEGEVEYLLADWDLGSRFSDRPECVDIVALARELDGTKISVWFGEAGWRDTKRLELSSPLRLIDDASRLESRPIALVLGSDTPFGGSGGVSACPFFGKCTCDVAVRAPTLFALSRCLLRAPSGGAEIYRLNAPTEVRYQATWLRDWACPAHAPISD